MNLIVKNSYYNKLNKFIRSWVARVPDRIPTQVRLERGEGVGRHGGSRPRQGPQKGTLACVGEAQQSHVRHGADFQPVCYGLALGTHLRYVRGLRMSRTNLVFVFTIIKGI